MAATKVNARKVGRRRRALGWVLVALGVLVAGVWVWSAGYTLSRDVGGGVLSVNEGRMIFWSNQQLGAGWHVFDNGRGRTRLCFEPLGVSEWRASAWVGEPSHVVDLFLFSYAEDRVAPVVGLLGWSVVLWPLPLVAACVGGVMMLSAWGLRRRAMAGLCAGCEYDLVGLGAGAKCPECGKGGGTK